MQEENGRTLRPAGVDATPGRVAGARGLFRLRYWPTWAAYGLSRLLAALPYRVLMVVGAVLGLLEYHLLFLRRRRAKRQIALCFPQHTVQGRHRLVRANFIAYGIGSMERLIGLWWPRRRLQTLINSVHGIEHLRRAQAAGRGVLLLVTHGTAMDMAGALVRTVHEVDGSYLPQAHPVRDWIQLRGRSRSDRLGVMIEAGNLREMLRRLRAGRVVWYAPDRYYEGKPYVMAPLFGQPAATITATSKYARLTGAAVMTLDYWRAPGGGYDLHIGAPWADFPSDDLLRDCTRINAWIEEVVRRHPEQHRWVHKRFKTPQGSASPSHDDILDSTVNCAAAPANECGARRRAP